MKSQLEVVLLGYKYTGKGVKINGGGEGWNLQENIIKERPK